MSFGLKALEFLSFSNWQCESQCDLHHESQCEWQLVNEDAQGLSVAGIVNEIMGLSSFFHMHIRTWLLLDTMRDHWTIQIIVYSDRKCWKFADSHKLIRF